MPKRVLDFDAMWASDKLASCASWAQAEYAWFYGLADASGSFEITNLRVIWGRVAAIRTNLTMERLEQIFDEFILRGLLFTWEVSGKRYAHWTGSDVPGRLPPPSWRARLEKLAPPVPQQQLAAYVARFSRGTKPSAAAQARTVAGQTLLPVQISPAKRDAEDRQECLSYSPRANVPQPLSPGLEPPQAQGLDLELEGKWNGNGESNAAAASRSTSAPNLPGAAEERNTQTNLFFSSEKIAEQPKTPYRSAPRPAYYPQNARAIEVAKELYVGAGPMLGPHSTARVKPEALERARRTEEAAAAARNARRARSG
jgi:hypothetical protein